MGRSLAFPHYFSLAPLAKSSPSDGWCLFILCFFVFSFSRYSVLVIAFTIKNSELGVSDPMTSPRNAACGIYFNSPKSESQHRSEETFSTTVDHHVSIFLLVCVFVLTRYLS